jgi:hypothetical protein
MKGSYAKEFTILPGFEGQRVPGFELKKHKNTNK